MLIEDALTKEEYRRQILEVLFIGEGFAFQENARPHRAAIVEVFHEEHTNYILISQSSRSPDLSPMEGTWDMLGKVLLTHNFV